MSLKDRIFRRGPSPAAEAAAVVAANDNNPADLVPVADDTAAAPPAAVVEQPAAPAAVAAPPAAVIESSEADDVADPGALAEACAAAGVPTLARALIDAKLPMAEAARRIETAKDVRGLVALAKTISPAIHDGLAEDFIRTGAAADHAGRRLLEMCAAAQSPEIASHHQPGPGTGGSAASGWPEVVANTNARHRIRR